MLARIDNSKGIYFHEQKSFQVYIKGESTLFGDQMCGYVKEYRDDIVAVVHGNDMEKMYLKAGDSIEIEGEEITIPEEEYAI